METPRDQFNQELLREVKKLRRKQEELNRKLEAMQKDLFALTEIKLRMEYMPGLIREQLQPLINQMEVARTPMPWARQEYQKYVPERKDSWNWKEHILYTLFHEERPLQTTELVDIHHELGVRGKKERRLVLKDISKNLTGLVREGRVVQYKPSKVSKFFYCLPKWMDEDGELKEEYFGRGAFL